MVANTKNKEKHEKDGWMDGWIQYKEFLKGLKKIPERVFILSLTHTFTVLTLVHTRTELLVQFFLQPDFLWDVSHAQNKTTITQKKCFLEKGKQRRTQAQQSR